MGWIPTPSSDLQNAAAAAKSLQSCLTLCDLVDCSLTDSSVHEIFQAIVLEWIAIFINCGKFFKRREYQTT